MATAYYEGEENLYPARRDPYDEYGPAPSLSIGIFIRNLLSTARRNLWLIAAIIISFLIAAIILTILTTPQYTARTSIEISNQSQQVLGEDFDQTTEQADSWDIDRFLNTQLAVLQSRALADRVAKKLNLYSNQRFLASVNVKPDEYANNQELRDGVLDAMAERLRVSLPGESSIAQVYFTSTDPEIAAQVANTFAAEFIQANLQRKFDSSSYARNFVNEQLADARARLEDSEQQLNVYARQANLIRTRDPSAAGSNGSAPTSMSVTTASLMQLNEASNTAKANRVAAEARWNAERAQPLLSSPAALDSPVVQGLLTRRAETQSQLQDAQARYLAGHPQVARLQDDLQNIESQLNRAASQARDAVRADYVAAQAAEQNLRQQVSQLEGATMEEQDRSVRYNTLAREADTNRSIYEGLLQRFRELNASAGITASNVSIVDVAEPPNNPSAPNAPVNILVALLLGTLTAAVVVFLKDQLDDRIRVPEEVEQKTGLSLLGVVPDSQDSDPIEALNDPKSIVSESYSALRSSMLYSTREGLPELILVTSAQASEGKSTTSYALARSLALVGKRTLLVDADLRRPSIHRLVEKSNKVGLSSILVGDVTAEQAIVPAETPNLSILTSGPVPPSPAELLTSTRLLDLFGFVRSKYDCVIVDSAPVLGLADSPGLSALADGVLLVIEANRGRGGQLKAAVRRLQMMKPRILGAVLTKFDPTAAGNAYSTYYQYNYYTYRSEAA